MNYQQAIEYLFSQLPAYHRIGKAAYKNDLHNTIVLDDYFGHPHLKYPAVHVAGTNGKGSVSHMIASVLMEAGYKTGLYTSPHLRDFRERIRVNGGMIPESAVTGFVSGHRDILGSLKPSFFEMTVAMAFNWFAEMKVDIAVIEVGLGGRLDSTNIITPVLSLITNIGHDHMDLLGNTFELVAKEKAGIIKKGIPVVISESQPETKDVFTARAGEMDSPISFADERFICTFEDYLPDDAMRRYSVTDTVTGTVFNGESVLCGNYQSCNIQAVFDACSHLRNSFRITDRNITDGIARVTLNTGFAGRWQVIGRNPLIVCDTGHNQEGIAYVMKQLEMIEKTALHMVVGFVNDKDLHSVLPLFPTAARYYFTKASVPRALDEEILKRQAEKYGLKGEAFASVHGALESARANALPADVIFIGGSTFIVAEVV